MNEPEIKAQTNGGQALAAKTRKTPIAAPDQLQGIQSVEIGASVLEALADGAGPMTLGEVARGSGLSLSQTRRYLVSLVRCGLAIQDSATGRYDLGHRVLRIGLAALTRVEAIELAANALRGLVAGIHETGTLSVWGDQGPTIVRWFRGGGIGLTSLGIGTVFPMFMSATGRVFLSYLPSENTRSIVERELGKRLTRGSKAEKEVQKITREVRQNGFARLTGHISRGVRGAGAPIFDAQGELVGVMAIAGFERKKPGGRDASVYALVEAAASVSRQLGFADKCSARKSGGG